MPEITIFGRYLPGNSLVHRMDPRAKLLLSLLAIVIIFCAQSFWGLGVCALFVVGFFASAQIGLRQAFRSVGPLFLIVLITALLNIFFIKGGTIYFEWAFLVVSEEGILRAVFIGIRLTLLLLSMSLFTLTTTTLDITDAFEYLFAPLRRIGMPAHELSMMMGIALRFLPQFALELQMIRNLRHTPISHGRWAVVINHASSKILRSAGPIRRWLL